MEIADQAQKVCCWWRVVARPGSMCPGFLRNPISPQYGCVMCYVMLWMVLECGMPGPRILESTVRCPALRLVTTIANTGTQDLPLLTAYFHHRRGIEDHNHTISGCAGKLYFLLTLSWLGLNGLSSLLIICQRNPMTWIVHCVSI